LSCESSLPSPPPPAIPSFWREAPIPPRFSSFFFLRHALFQVPYSLPRSVSSKSFACHSCENCRGVYQLFPLWNLPRKKLLSISVATTILGSSASPPSPVSPSPNDYPSFFSDPCALFCAFLHPHKSQLLYFQPIPHSSAKNEAFAPATPASRPILKATAFSGSRNTVPDPEPRGTNHFPTGCRCALRMLRFGVP